MQSSRWLVPLLIALLTVAAFIPMLENGFVSWDDKATLLENQNYRGLGWEQLRWMFTTFYTGHYQPLSWVTFGLDYLLWGMDPFGYHLTNLLLHTANAVLFYFLCVRLLSLAQSATAVEANFSLRISAGLAALLFAVHPLRVESVAWATERRDVLAALFFLLTLLFYLRGTTAARSNRSRLCWLSGTLMVYGLSLLSKAIGMTLPIVLLVLDVYPLRRLGDGRGRWFGPAARKVWYEKVPFLILASGTAVAAFLAQYQAGAMEPIKQYGGFARMAQALYGLVFYLWKTLIPVGLSPLYEIPPRLDPWDWSFLLSGLMVLGISLWLFVFRRRWPAGLAIWVCYVAILTPVLGGAQSGPQLVADRYSYLSCLGWATLAGAGIFHFWEAWVTGGGRRLTFFLATGLAGVVVVGLGVLTWKQVRVWRDTKSLFKHIVSVAPDSRTAHYNLGYLLASQGKFDEAIKHYHEAIRIDPDDVEALINLSNVLKSQGKLEEAIGHYRRALRINPTYSIAHNALGVALARQGKIDEAIGHFREALRIDPTNPTNAWVHANLGNLLASQGELERAIEHYRWAVQMEPEFADAHERLGRLLAQHGKRDEAIQHIEEALRIMKSRDTPRAHIMGKGKVRRGEGG